MAVLPRLRTLSRLPRGPRALNQPVTRVSGPGEPPDGFVRPTTSKTEWFVYWALAKIFGLPIDPRKPPYTGGEPFWAYQQGTGGDGTRSRPDFVVYRPRRLILRVQTEFHHIYADNQKQVYDRMQRAQQSQRNDVVDIFDQAFVNDASGQAVIVAVKRALGLLQDIDPITGGTARRGSRGAL